MAKTTSKKAPAFASLNPDDMMQGGLPSDFRGKITEAVYVKWDYDGKIDNPVLAARITIAGDELDNPIVQHWSAGDLAAFVPSDEDGDETDEGEYIVRVGKRAEMNNNTNFAHLMKSILDSGEAAKGKPFGRKQLTPSLACLVGLDAQWDRVPQQKRSGMTDVTAPEEAEDAPKKRGKDILVVTEVFGYDPDGADEAPAAKPKAKVKAAPVEDEDEEVTEDEESEVSPLDAKIDKAIAKELANAGGSLKKGKLATAMLKAFGTDKDKKKIIERCSEDEFLSDAARSWDFDEDTGVLTAKDDEY